MGDFDFEDERSKRKHTEARREHSMVRDSEPNRAAESHTADRPRLPYDPAKFRGRGNGPVRISMMQNLQHTQGNRAVQRYFHTGNKELDAVASAVGDATTAVSDVVGNLPVIGDAAKPVMGELGEIGSVIGSAINGAIRASNYNPMIDNMWKASVQGPLDKAVERLRGLEGTEKPEVGAFEELLSDVKNARHIIRELKEGLEEADGDTIVIGQLREMNNRLVAIEAGLQTHIPGKEDITGLDMAIEGQIDDAEVLGNLLMEKEAEGRLGKKSTDPVADNPLAARLWKSTVTEPMKKAAKLLRGHPKKAQIAEAAEDLKRAQQMMQGNEILGMFDPDINNRMGKVVGALKFVERLLLDQMGKQVPLEELVSDAGTAAAISIAIGYNVSHVPPPSSAGGAGDTSGATSGAVGGIGSAISAGAKSGTK